MCTGIMFVHCLLIWVIDDGLGEVQCFHFQGIFLVLAKSKEFWMKKKVFFKEFQKFKDFQGNLRKEKEIIQKFREFKEIWVKCKEN